MDKARHKIEKRTMSAEEYVVYKNKNFRWDSLRNNFECVECGDPVHFVEGALQKPHFRHMPSKEGHNYCPEYAEDKSTSKTHEAILRKKLFNDADFLMNFEIGYINGSWGSFLTIPPFKKDELLQHENNETCIEIYCNGSKSNSISLDINIEKFSVGEMKKIKLNGFPSYLYIRVNGNGTKKIMSYTFDAFKPYEQIYSYLISQNYDFSNDLQYIDLSRIKTIYLKKTVGKLYTGRHYVILAQSLPSDLDKLNSEFVTIKRIVIPSDKNLRYSLFDICFNKINDDVEKFCANRGCEIVQRDDAVILWPPVISVGDYKYYSIKNKLFVSAETNYKSNDIKAFDISKKFFLRVDNFNSEPFCVTYNKEVVEDGMCEIAKTNVEETDSYKFNNLKAFLFENGVLVKSVDNDCNIPVGSSIIEYKNSLESNYFVNSIVKYDTDRLIDAIRYSLKLVKFETKYFQMLKKEYMDNQMIVDYLDLCFENGYIKEEALDILMEV